MNYRNNIFNCLLHPIDPAIPSCGWRCFSFGCAAHRTYFDFWPSCILHQPWKFPSADESKFVFFTHNTWSFLISFPLIIKKHFADIDVQICLLADSPFPVHSYWFGNRGLVPTAQQRICLIELKELLLFLFTSACICLYSFANCGN